MNNIFSFRYRGQLADFSLSWTLMCNEQVVGVLTQTIDPLRNVWDIPNLTSDIQRFLSDRLATARVLFKSPPPVIHTRKHLFAIAARHGWPEVERITNIQAQFLIDLGKR